MKEVLLKLTKYISSLNFIDILFFCTLMVLIILIVILINTIKSTRYKEVDIIKENDELTNEEKLLEEKINKASDEEPLDLVALTKEIEEKPSLNIDLTNYEKEQEEKAIISYDELVKARNNYAINYEDEDLEDGILVKKVNLENLTTPIEEEIISDNKTNITISYEHEEAFLEALKQLQEMLNS